MLPHAHPHPQFHPRGCDWSASQILHVAVAYTNPARFRRRRELMENFRQEMARHANVVLHVAEAAYGDLPFEVADPAHPFDYQYRARDVLWLKENLGNLAVSHFPPDWKYGAFIDGDCTFTRHDWALETVQKLQHHQWVQLFSTYSDLDARHAPTDVMPSCVAQYLAKRKLPTAYIQSATGLAWAFRREAFDACGGFLDRAILGSADWHMAVGLLGEPDESFEATVGIGEYGRFADYIRIWQRRALAHCRRDVGMIEQHAVHHHHGPKALRGYGERWKILLTHAFDPYVDVYPDARGLLQLTPDKPGLRDALRDYATNRNEDDPCSTVR